MAQIPDSNDVRLTRQRVAEALSAAGYPISHRTLATKATRGGGPPYSLFSGRALYRWGKRLVDTAARRPELFNEREDEREAAHVELIENLLATLSDASSFETDRGDRTRQAQSRLVRIAEEYAMSKAGDRLFVTDLCRATGVSERTLEYAFRETMGLTPMSYLIRLRLHRVRQSLLAGNRRTTTVTREALRWGFWHFGEFSRAYKDCFGELPSETLRQAPREANQ